MSTQTPSRDAFAHAALALIPSILTLLDRNPHSATYGCFDRNYWHYKIIDFPSGMSQEFVWPLALAYHTDLPGNIYYQNPQIAIWIQAGLDYMRKSAHADGSCDDYFPFEKAGGATAFALLAALGTLDIMDWAPDTELKDFLIRRANWLAGHHESGRLTNHQALIALCLVKLGTMLKTDIWESAIALRLDRLLEWQSEEGWFQEYEGFDPGYQSLTVGCLAEILEQRPDAKIENALRKAVALCLKCVHPDGTYGGEYGSRNTLNYFPHSFELAAKYCPEALAANDQFLTGLVAGKQPCYHDDHILGHHTWSYLRAWRYWQAERSVAFPCVEGRHFLSDAGLLIERRGDLLLYANLKKGGTFKIFQGTKLSASDTQWSVQVRQGNKLRNAVGHLIGGADYTVMLENIRITGALGWAKQAKMTPLKMMILRVVMLTVGQFYPDQVRKMLQLLLITGKKPAPFRFERAFTWQGNQLHIEDKLMPEQDWAKVDAIGIGPDQTSIYVVMSRTFRTDQLLPWQHFDVPQGQSPITFERIFE